MKIGISTASMYGKMYTEEALDFFNKNGVEYAEVFLASFSEYTEEFGKKLQSVKGNVNVHSIHTLNSQFEGQLFSRSERQYADALKIFRSALKIGEMLNAEIYVMHGPQQMKYTKYVTNYEFFGTRTAELARIAKEYGILLTWENVHWAHYNHPQFMRNLLPYCDAEIGCTLDIKQAAQSDTLVDKYIDDMCGRIKNLHIVDFDEEGRLVLPTTGNYDYKSLFKKMGDYDNTVMIEVYDGCYKDPKEIIDCYNKFKELYS
jgi:sugar phosphate isomerase/epimerase